MTDAMTEHFDGNEMAFNRVMASTLAEHKFDTNDEIAIYTYTRPFAAAYVRPRSRR